MNDTIQIAGNEARQGSSADHSRAVESDAAKITSVLLKIVLAILGLGVGGFIGLIIAFSTGLIAINITC